MKFYKNSVIVYQYTFNANLLGINNLIRIEFFKLEKLS